MSPERPSPHIDLTARARKMVTPACGGIVLLALACNPSPGRRSEGAPPARMTTAAPPPTSAVAKDPIAERARAHAAAHPLEVFVVEGRIHFGTGRGAAVQLTSSGVDKDACLSPDRTRVAFIRGKGDGTSPGDGLWVVGVDGKGAERLVAIEPDDPAKGDPGRRVWGLARPQFSPDGHTIFFQTWGWMVSRAVQAVDITTRKVRFVSDGSRLRVVIRGPSAGSLLVARHLYEPRVRDEWWLLAPDGRPLRSLGVWEADGDEERIRRRIGD